MHNDGGFERFWARYQRQPQERQERIWRLMFLAANGCPRTARLMKLFNAGQIGADDLLRL